MTSSRQFPPRLPQEDRAVESRLGFAGSRAGRARNAGPLLQVDRVTAQVSAASQAVETSFWYEDHFTVSSTTPGTFTLTYVPRDNSEDITVNGVTLLPGTEWTRTGATLTITSGVWLGLTGSWDLLVQYEVASTTATVATTPYGLDIIANGAVGYWRLDESSGTVMADSSGNGHDGVYTGSPTLGATGLLVGDTDTAAAFNGTSQYSTVAYGAWMDSPSITLEALIKPAAIGAGQMIMSRDGLTFTRVFQFNLDTAGKLNFQFWDLSNTYHLLVGATTLVAGTAYHVAATHTGTVATIYVNGVADGTLTVPSGLPASTWNLWLGAYNPGTYYFNGTLDELAYYTTALTGTQIAADATTAGY